MLPPDILCVDWLAHGPPSDRIRGASDSPLSLTSSSGLLVFEYFGDRTSHPLILSYVRHGEGSLSPAPSPLRFVPCSDRRGRAGVRVGLIGSGPGLGLL